MCSFVQPKRHARAEPCTLSLHNPFSSSSSKSNSTLGITATKGAGCGSIVLSPDRSGASLEGRFKRRRGVTVQVSQSVRPPFRQGAEITAAHSGSRHCSYARFVCFPDLKLEDSHTLSRCVKRCEYSSNLET